MKNTSTRRQENLTFKGNLKHTRYGWLRLTPAYSSALVREILNRFHHYDRQASRILDPFCGTGTTALVCAEQGISCDTTDINPFLLWLGKTKTQQYSSEHAREFLEIASSCIERVSNQCYQDIWIPPLYNIDRWWEQGTLQDLAFLMNAIHETERTATGCVVDLLKVAFCRVMIETSNVSFGHQSMSFQKEIPTARNEIVLRRWQHAVSDIGLAALSPVHSTPRFFLTDARCVSTTLRHQYYTHIITSPPYPNRVSYIRELRPYMYWLRYLTDSRMAGEMDWLAIGGTWGIATSRVGKWEPESTNAIPFPGFEELVAHIKEHSPLLSRYVHKYFYDITKHLQEVFLVTRSGASLTYIVGNSKFYDVVLPVEQIYAHILSHIGFVEVTIQKIRKRSSKKELFEYIVSAHKP